MYALIWHVLSPEYKAGALTNMSNRGVIYRSDHAGIRGSSNAKQVIGQAYRHRHQAAIYRDANPGLPQIEGDGSPGATVQRQKPPLLPN